MTITKKPKKNYTEFIGYALFVMTVIVWIFTAGMEYSKFNNLETDIKEVNTKLEKQEKLLLEQQNFNGRVSNFMEIMLSSKNNTK
jgi:hypothetical protein